MRIVGRTNTKVTLPFCFLGVGAAGGESLVGSCEQKVACFSKYWFSNACRTGARDTCFLVGVYGLRALQVEKALPNLNACSLATPGIE